MPCTAYDFRGRIVMVIGHPHGRVDKAAIRKAVAHPDTNIIMTCMCAEPYQGLADATDCETAEDAMVFHPDRSPGTTGKPEPRSRDRRPGARNSQPHSRNHMTRRRRRDTPPLSIAWTWETDDPAAEPCEARHLDVTDQSAAPSELRVYDSLLACELDLEPGEMPEVEAAIDAALANILVFADDCKTACAWLENETVSHADEQGRRAAQRRRHLKERGFLKDGRRFVRICGAMVTEQLAIEVMAARQCIDAWEHTFGERSLWFGKKKNRMRWAPRSEELDESTMLKVANPFTADPPSPDADGRIVETYTVVVSDDGAATAEPTATVVETDDPGIPQELHPGWVLNARAHEAMTWLGEAAEAVADLADSADSPMVRELFPSWTEMERLRRRKEDDDARAEKPPETTPPTATPEPDPTVH